MSTPNPMPNQRQKEKNMKCECANHVGFGTGNCRECFVSDEYQIQIVLTKRLTNGSTYIFEEVLRTDPVYYANVDSSGHAQAVVASIERYGKSL